MKQKQPVNILVIDDEAYIRQSLAIYLSDYGFRVVEASGGNEGLASYHQEPPDLVLLDLLMPDLGGIDVLERMAPNTSDIPVIVVSGTGDMTAVAQALRLGASDYIFKPIKDLAVLKYAIENALKSVRLKQENRAYQERLEELVRERTLALKESEFRYRAIFEYTGTCAVIVEPDHIISMANSRFADLVGYSRVSIEGLKTWQEFVPEGDVDTFENHLNRYMEAPESIDPSVQYEAAVMSRDGSIRYVLANIGQIPGTGSLVVSLMDMTEKKQAEKRWQSLERQLRKSQKMEAIGTLAGGIAHDLNNILSPILGYSDMIMRTCEPGSGTFRRSEKIQKAALRAAALVRQIVTFNRDETEEKRLIKLHPVLLEALTLLRGSIPSTIEITEDINRNCSFVLTDPTQIHQVIMNLCTNAFHAMEDTGGQLWVGLDEIELSPGQMAVSPNLIQGDGHYLRIRVKDTGCGMTEDIVERIFDPYFTTKEEGRGTGLGLAMAYSIVNACQGEIRVESRPGQGSCFTVLLPARQAETGNDRGTGIFQTAFAAGGERLLVVDDDINIVMMCKDGLQHLGYQVEAFSSSDEALAYFKAHHARIDLVVTDQTMPGKTGLELAQEMISIKENLPVILCSGYATAITPHSVQRAGIRRFIMKPVTVDSLSREIQQVLNP